MKISTIVGLGALVSVSSAAFSTQAQEFQPEAKGTFMVDLRVSDVTSNASDPILTAAGAPTGLHVKIGNSVMPTLGFTYFLTSHFAVEAILGTTEHDIYARGAGASTKVASTWALPPVITLQYHPLPRSRISPYIGAGVNAMVYYGGGNANGFTVNLRDELGYVFQAGANVAISGPWSANLDAKKVFTDTYAKIDGGALHSNVSLNPWVLSLGVGRKF